MSTAPVLSIILICQNPGPRLPAALASVWEQGQVAPEIIVIDRGSTDGSLAWLESQRARLTQVVSAPTDGLFDAMNRGVALARGEWVYFFGADARLVGDLILSESINWLKKTEAGVASGEAAINDGRIFKLSSNVNPRAGDFVHPRASFYRRTLFAENDGFDPAFTVMAAYEFHARLWKNRVRFKPIPLRIAACSSGGAFDHHSWRACREEIAVRHRYFSAARCLAGDVSSLVRFFGRKLVPGRLGR